MPRPTRQLSVAVAAMVGILAAGTATVAWGDSSSDGGNSTNVRLSGYQEDLLVLSSPATGEFRLHIDEAAQEISYELSYSGFPTPVTQAHIHFGGAAQNGGISAFLCSNLGNGPAGTPACPTPAGTVTGTLTPASVVGPAAQGIAAGEFAELVAAIRAGVTYANVHTNQFQGGEIRAQIT